MRNDLALVADIGIGIGIEKPKRDINALYFIDAVFGPEYLREQAFALEMLAKPCLCRLLIQFEGDNEIRLERAAQLARNNNRVAAIGAFRCGKRFIPDNFAAAGFADINVQIFGFLIVPLPAGIGIPFKIVAAVAVQILVVAAERFGIEFRIAIRAFHLLRIAVEFDPAAAARAFILLLV